ncbi:MAG: efflux RND transporter periplasmic adaptor subunit [Cyanobacteria bacterium J06641_5]
MKLSLARPADNPLPWLVGAAVVVGVVVAVPLVAWRATQPKYDLNELTVTVAEQELTARIKASGTVVPVKTVNISPKTSGRLAELQVNQGDRVAANSILAVMENRDALAQRLQAEANLAEVKARLAEARSGSRSEEIAQAEARLRQTEAQLSEARARIPRDIDRAQAQVDSARARFNLARGRLESNRNLVTQGAISQDRFNEIESEFNNAAADLDDARKRLQQVQETDRPEVARMEALVTESRASLAQMKNGTRSETIDSLTAQVAAAEAELKRVAIAYDDTFVRAPFGGIITQKYATEGAFVTPTTSASTTASATSASILALAQGLEVLAKVAEVDVGQIQVGQPVEIIADAFPDRIFVGETVLVAPEAVVEQNVTSFEVRVAIKTGLDVLRSGMNADVTFLGDTIDAAVVVPTVAVVTQKGQTGVMLVNKKEKPKFQAVTLGLTLENQTQILDGLSAGDRVFIDIPEELQPKENRR